MGTEVIVGLHMSEFLPLLVWMVAVFGIPQGVKKLARSYGFREHWILERALPIMPVIIGVVTAVLYPAAIGLPRLVEGDTVPVGYAAVLGGVAGLCCGQIWKIFVEVAPESWRPVLSQVSDGGEE